MAHSVHSEVAVVRSAGKGSDDSFAQAEAIVHRIVAERHDRPSLVSVIASKIGAAIVEGIRRPGDDLNSVDLAALYHTSRTPIREALMLLEKERLVEIPPRRRPRVVILGLEEIREIYITRAALLEIVALNVATNANGEEMQGLKQRVNRMAAAARNGDMEAYFWANVAFHEYNTQIGGNNTIRRIVESLLLRTLPLRRFSLSRHGAIEHSCNDHLQLMRAYENRDSNLSAALIRSSHYSALKRIEEHYRDQRLAGRYCPYHVRTPLSLRPDTASFIFAPRLDFLHRIPSDRYNFPKYRQIKI